jgi:hypothetical protein
VRFGCGAKSYSIASSARAIGGAPKPDDDGGP